MNNIDNVHDAKLSSIKGKFSSLISQGFWPTFCQVFWSNHFTNMLIIQCTSFKYCMDIHICDMVNTVMKSSCFFENLLHSLDSFIMLQ